MREHKGAEVVGVVGFCWGGKMAMKAASLGPEGGVNASGCVHPAMLSPELAGDVSYGAVLLHRRIMAQKMITVVLIDNSAFWPKDYTWYLYLYIPMSFWFSCEFLRICDFSRPKF